MRLGSLIVLGTVFFGAFAGRAAVLAAKSASAGETPHAASAHRCIDGAFADELRMQSDRYQSAAASRADEDQKRSVFLKHVNERIDEMEKANAAFSAAAAKSADADAASATKVAGLYERMKPELAGVIIGGMDPSFAAGLLLAMNSESASGILASLAPERAYAITVLMADAS